MKKLQKCKKGFTLTELAIVIAVIAILVAVLVPTFTSLINKAKLSSDSANVYNFNTALSLNVDTPADINEVADILEENGYNMPVEPVTSGYKYVWDSENNQIYMVDSSTLAVYYPENVTATNTEAWYDFKTRAIIGNSADATYSSGTYTVKSVSGWYYVAEGINDGTISSSANITLANDLEFTSEYTYPINTYSGTLDGSNYTISGLTISGDTYFENDYYSFIQYLKGGTIQNVTFDDVSINAGSGESGVCSVAALVGRIYENSTISNVTVNGEITGVCRASGLVGVAGYVDADKTFTIENCVNNATVTSLGGDSGSNKYAQAGGLISQVWTNISPIIDGCVNNGAVTAYLGESSGTTLAGGIIANDASINGEYKNCKNTGAIYCEGDAAGGIIGMNSKNGDKAVSVTSCTNNGIITAQCAGGIVGSSQRVTFSDCENEGAVIGQIDYSLGLTVKKNGETVAKTGSAAGGIVGSMSNCFADTTLYLTSCKNTATVTSIDSYAGGIVGETGNSTTNNGTIEISDCNGGTATLTGGNVTVQSGYTGDDDDNNGSTGRIAGKLKCGNDYSININLTVVSSDNTIGQIAGATVNITSGTLVGGVTIQNAGLGNYLIFTEGTTWDSTSHKVTFTDDDDNSTAYYTYYKGQTDNRTTWYNTETKTVSNSQSS